MLIAVEMASKVILVTGASRGIGHAVAKHLLDRSHKVVLVSRSRAELEALKSQYPSQVEYLAEDLTDFAACIHLVVGRLCSESRQVAPEATELAVKAFGRLDGIVINHGVLSPITKIADSNADDWRRLYDANVFSALALVRPALRPAHTT